MSASVTRLPTCPPEGEEASDQALVRMVQTLPRGSAEHDTACEALVSRYQSLVRSCARRYWQSPEPLEELMQVGYVGLLKAINNFDPAVGSNLAACAQPCISGEIKRHFRDKRWSVHVQRSAQELRLEMRRARAELTQRLARSPRPEELASHLGVSDADLTPSVPTRSSRPRRWTRLCQTGPIPRTWPTSWARTIRSSSTRSTWRPFGRTGATCPNASSAC